jgi:hypothetical protein
LFLRGKNDALRAASYVPRELVSTRERWFSNGATQADLDGDGHLDLIIGNYFQDGAEILNAAASGVQVMHDSKSKANNGGRDHIFLWQSAAAGNEPLVSFREASDCISDEVSRAWTLAVGAADLDGDMLPEVYLGSDFGPDFLLHNRSSPGRLEESRAGFRVVGFMVEGWIFCFRIMKAKLHRVPFAIIIPRRGTGYTII